jgi:hypothetical protein
LARGWQRIGVEPLAGSIFLQQGEESDCIWQVNQAAQKVTVSRVSTAVYDRADNERIQTAGGVLVGEDHGEWGGSLSLLETNGGPPRLILDKNVVQMLQMKSGILVVTGDLPANEGSIWLYSITNGREWSIEKRAELSGYPRVIGRSNSGILLVNADGVFLVDDSLKVQKLAELPLFDVRPTSVAEDADGTIYIGMKAFVVRLVPNRTGYTHEWFAGAGCLP